LFLTLTKDYEICDGQTASEVELKFTISIFSFGNKGRKFQP
jgi:hypothetical protein